MSSATQSLSLMDSLSSLKQGLSNEDPLSRLQALEHCRKLQAELENPGETLLKITWAETTHHWVLYAAQDLNLFGILSEDNEAPKTSTQIAEKANAEPILTGRLLRQMASMNSVAEVGPDTFALNKFSRYLLTETGASTMTFWPWFEGVTIKAPEYLAKHNWKSAMDPRNTPCVWAYGLGDVTLFEHISQDPKLGASFGGTMRAVGEREIHWSDGQLYPVKERLSSVEDPNGVLVVDIEGGNGHDLDWFRKKHPEMKGRLVLQDLPYITDTLKLEGIEVMAHDFNDEQPIKGAQVYFLQHITHDYDDDTVLKILRAVVPAMKPGYSKLLISEIVLPNQGAHWYPATLDLVLMLGLSARERTRAQFMELIAKVGGGLRVEQIWEPSIGGSGSVIECVVDPATDHANGY